ncbi:uncharacterized protein [Spinacia oleracea]|uniref:Transposase-associated domain-containing protein n=1 Tax=Spinacia oleracea TaxID=3562 RepID=A0ABM3R804_SPIOL|nr:uncharacterized protein LOC130467298 [Spinacia oleracea]
MDRSWISNSKPGDPRYEVGIRDFINFVVEHAGDRSRLPCPCFKCHNFLYRPVDEILGHLCKNSFDKTYTHWIWHGENYEGITTGNFGNNVHESPNDVQECSNLNEGGRLGDTIRSAQDKFDENPSAFQDLLKDSEMPLYPGCKKYTRLSAVVRLYNEKAGHGLTDKSFEDILEVVKDFIPDDNVFPSRNYEAKKTLTPMGLPYQKVHACPNDCVLYQHENETLNEKVAKKLTWHYYGRNKNGLLRHPVDSPQWKFIDGKFPEFRKEKRNLRLALSTYSMNPFGSLSSTHSTWPAKTAGNDIDVYLVPLIDDLKILWDKGVEVFDAHRNEMFNLRAMMFCTIQDYPAYGNLSGYTVKGKTACPVCEDSMEGKWLSASKKTVYLVHHKWLPINHLYRKKRKAFDGEQEFEDVQGHCLDVMHIEKNICDSLVGTLLNVPGKSKDGVSPRDDLMDLGIRKELHVVERNTTEYLPPAAYTLSQREKKYML